MTTSKTLEIEAKFLIRDPVKIKARLENLGASLIVPRTLELNLRLDTSEGDLERNGQVLRLRKSDRITITYKGRSTIEGGVFQRTEVEIHADSLDMSLRLFEALGYHISQRYEKFRTVFSLNNTTIMLDELPVGMFIEIEGSSIIDIQNAAALLELDWHAAIESSYVGLFNRLQKKLGLHDKELTFQSLEGISISTDILEVDYADQK